MDQLKDPELAEVERAMQEQLAARPAPKRFFAEVGGRAFLTRSPTKAMNAPTEPDDGQIIKF